MSNEHKQSETQQTTNKPYMLGYTVRPIGKGEKSSWSKIAVAWAHKDGLGYNVQMDAVPVDGKLVLRTVPEDHGDIGETIEPTPDGLS